MLDLSQPLHVQITMSARMSRIGHVALYKARKGRAFLLYCAAGVSALGCVMFSAVQVFYLMLLQSGIRMDMERLARVQFHPGVANTVTAAGQQSLPVLPDYAVQFESIYLFMALAGGLPTMAMLLFFYLQRSGGRQPDHVLDVCVDIDGVGIRCGGTTISHKWQSISKVIFSPSAQWGMAVLAIELDYGATHAWPAAAFADRETYLMAGHRLTALFLAARTPKDPQ